MKLRSKILIAGAVSSSVLIGGAAFAFWSASGSGNGAAATANPSAIALSGNLADALYPGASVGLMIKAQNTNPGAITIGPVATSATFGSASLDALCPITVTTLNQNTPLGGSMSAAVDIGAVTVAMINSPTVDQSACANKPITLNYTTLALLP